MDFDFSSEEKQRYSKQFLLPEVGEEGQRKLKQAKVLIVGMGGLGSPSSLYLAAAGVGTLGIVDFDQVDLSNLQRQVLYRTDDQDHSKAARAAASLKALNPNIEVKAFPEELYAENAERLISPFDLVIDGTDNSRARLAINDTCLKLRKPWIYGSVHRYEGQFTVFIPGQGPCYRCLFPNPSVAADVPNCSQAGVLGVLPGLVGTFQAAEALKLLLGLAGSTPGTLFQLDSLNPQIERFEFRTKPDCLCQMPIGQPISARVEEPCTFGELDPKEFLEWNARGDQILLIDVRTHPEFDQYNIGGLHLPLDTFESEFDSWLGQFEKVDPNLPIVVVCAAGVRSAYASEILIEKGFRKVWNLTGGLKRLKKHMLNLA